MYTYLITVFYNIEVKFEFEKFFFLGMGSQREYALTATKIPLEDVKVLLREKH